MSDFSHLDKEGNAQMVNVGQKAIQHRKAIAEGAIYLTKETIEKIKQFQIKKGDVLTVAKIAGIQAVKQTALLIPLCHPIAVHHIQIDFEILSNKIIARSTVECDAKTGVEMEALTAVSVSLLAIYDMCKAVDKSMHIEEIKLLEKTKTNIE